MNSFEIVLSLLRSSLWREDPPLLELGEGWWSEVYEISKSQGVHTLLLDAFRSGCVPGKTVLARWLLDVERAEYAWERIEGVSGELSEKWTQSGIRFAVLKGSTASVLYPEPKHRLPGDIDFFFPDSDGLAKADRIAKGLADTGTDSDGDIHYRYKGVVVEHHAGWTHLSSPAASRIEARLDGSQLCPEDTLLSLSSHILRHSLVGGAGLRQLADLAVAVRYYNGKYDKDALRARMENLGLGKWGGLLSSVLKDSFGVPEEELFIAPDKECASEYMALVRFDGDLGKESQGVFDGFLRRARLFLKVAPKEYFARFLSLFAGRLKRMLGIGRK